MTSPGSSTPGADPTPGTDPTPGADPASGAAPTPGEAAGPEAAGVPEEEQRIDPARSACVLIGVDAYTELPPLKSVPHNLVALESALGDPDIWGIPASHRWVVRNPQAQWDVTDAIRDAMAVAEDTLFVYYAGHGLLDIHDEELHLTLPHSMPGRTERALPYKAVRRVLQEGKGAVQRRVMVLDCCYSGQVLERMSAGQALDAGRIGIDGSYVLTSAAEDARSVARRDDEFTAFTGELVKVLREGVPGTPRPVMLTLNQIYEVVRRELSERELPVPQRQERNGVGNIPFVWNRYGVRPEPAEPRGRAWSVRRRIVAGAVIAALSAGLGVGGTLWWQEAQSADGPPRESSGPCGRDSGASLTGVSDLLDTTVNPDSQIKGENPAGLSALALTGDGKALALTDNTPARVFEVPLGVKGSRLDLGRPTDALSLRHRGGTTYASGIDGEGMVLEKGGETLLVSSEDGPRIHRFAIADREERKADIPIPRNFTDGPKGQGQVGRSLEALTATRDGAYLFAGMEGPLSSDGDAAGSGQVRIQRYTGEAGGDYALDHQYAYKTDPGLSLVELVALDKDRLLALERGYLKGMGNVVRVHRFTLQGAPEIEDMPSLHDKDADTFVKKEKELVVDLATCPAGTDVRYPQQEEQPSPLLENVEGMALGDREPGGDRRPLYLVSDNNESADQRTRVYALSVRLP